MYIMTGLLFYGMIFFVDRYTKYCVLNLSIQRYELNQFITIQPILNRGISWGVLHTASNNIFMVISSLIIIITFLIAGYTYMRWQQKLSILGECFVLTGSVSNIIDRITYHGVIDFILLSYNGWSWPIFNIADVAIVVGISIMFVQGYKEK